MSDEIPYAQPFPWANEQQPQRNPPRSLRKRKFVGSGFAVLREEAMSTESKIGNVAKNILMNLFHQHGVELEGEMESDAHKFKGIGVSTKSKPANCSPRSNENNVQIKGSNNGVSIFIELLKIISEAVSSPISTRQILRQICVLLQPGTLPGIMDSRDMVLAALHFLASKGEVSSEHLLQLPLIRPLQPYADLERRNYEKLGDWKLEDITEQLLRMEELFLSSPSSWKWQKRESLSLKLAEADEESFFMTGTVPLCATASAKKSKAEATKKRKPKGKQTKADPKEIEASIDETESNDEPLVEATILSG